MRILGFDWDETNKSKLELHDLEPHDAEALFDLGAAFVFNHPSDSRRHIALGFVPDDRFVLVVFEYNKTTRWVRVVNAYEPTNPRWWKKYAQAKGFEG